MVCAAQLRMQSFVTGVLYVALDARPDTPIVLRGLDPKVPELPTVPTDIEVWTAKLEKFADAIEKVPLDQIAADGVVGPRRRSRQIVESKETHELFRNANAAIVDARRARRQGRRADRSAARPGQGHARPTRHDAWTRRRKLVVDVDDRIEPLATQAEGALKAAQAALGDARPLIEDLRRLAAKLDAQADPLLTSFRSTSDTARTALERRTAHARQRGPHARAGVAPGLRAVPHVEGVPCGRAVPLRSLADYLERVPDAAVYGLRRPQRSRQVIEPSSGGSMPARCWPRVVSLAGCAVTDPTQYYTLGQTATGIVSHGQSSGGRVGPQRGVGSPSPWASESGP